MNTPDNSIRVLLIEDNPGDVRLIREMLQETKGRKIVLEHCATLTQGLQALSKNDFNILLLDLTLPDSIGFDTFVKVYTQNPQIPIVVLTGTNDEELAIKSVRTGAQDYLIKGQIDSSLLSRSISYAIERAGLLRIVQQELIERKAMESMLRKVNRALRMLSECNEIVVRATEENVLAEKICGAITAVGEYQFAWVAFTEPDDSKSIRPIAIAGSKDGNSPEEASAWFKRDPDSPLSEALSTGKVIVCDDVMVDKRCSNLRVEADKLGYRSFVILPLLASGRTLGILQICSREPDRFNREELKLLNELKEDIAYAIVSIRTEKERRRAEEALRENEEKLRVLFEQLPIGVSLLDKNRKVMYVNPALEKILDISKDDLLQEKHQTRRYIRPDGTTMPPEEFASVRAFKEQKLVRDIEIGVITESGKTIWTSVSAAPFPMVDEGLLIVTADITERKRAEEALQESELRFRSLYENTTIGLYRTTPDGNILLANPALVKILGYTSFQKLTERNLEKDGFESSSQRKEFLEKIERDGEVIGYDSKWMRLDGTAIFVLESARAIRDSHGKTLYYDGTVEDITERKQMEEGLRQMQRLEGLGTLAGGIAHDFNNILGIILAYITSIKRFKDDTKKLDLAIDTIMKAVDRGKTLVRQILTFARKSDVAFGPVNVNDVVMEIMVMIFETFPKILTYAQNFDKGIPYINADRSQLHQALLNLCVNARDAMPSGGLLTINTRMVSGLSLRNQHPDAFADGNICIEVIDTGEGMSDEIRNRIFEPFFTTKEQDKGTGLGLSVVFGVVQTHKGFIDVESELGKGTTFRLYLPASQAAEPISEKDEETLEEIPGGTETLLVVEDEEMLMMSLRMVLVERGYKVISAEDGLAAVNIYKERKKEIALVLTDLGLPKMSGMDVCAQIKKLNPSARMIVATGFLDPEMKSEFLKAGVQHFLYKPYDLKKVLKVVREVLEEK
jgi:two-component system, cell cycle sensor histidine kinase and response regulator CckA